MHLSNSVLAESSGDQIPVGAKFSAPVQAGSGAYPASSTMDNRILFLGAKLPGSGVDHVPHLAPRLEKEYGNVSNPLCAFVAFSRVQFISSLFLFFMCLFLHTKSQTATLVGWLVGCLLTNKVLCL